MIVLWIILGIIVIPAILNVVYAYTIVKFNLWNAVSEMILCECKPNHKIDKITIILLIVPFVSSIYFISIVGVYFAIPFIWLYGFIVNSLFEHFNKIEEKRKFFEKINNRHKE